MSKEASFFYYKKNILNIEFFLPRIDQPNPKSWIFIFEIADFLLSISILSFNIFSISA